jgi:hypothetical protein
VSLRAIPLIVIPFVLYNVIALIGGTERFAMRILPDIKMLSGGVWSFTWGDLIILVLLITLFIEILKSTYTSSVSLLDHGLSMLVFVACLVEFLIVPQAATTTFFFVTFATLIDVIAGYTIGIRVAKRDLQIGTE